MSAKDRNTLDSSASDEDLFAEFKAPEYSEWRTEVERLLKGAPYEKRMQTRTHEGIILEPMYRKEDIEGLSHVDSFPGHPPYTRGRHKYRLRESAWEIAQEVTYPTYEEFNEALSLDMKKGLNAVTLKLDMASRAGFDPDQANVGQVGADGVSISSIHGLSKALDRVDLSEFPIYLHAGSSGLPYLGMLAALARKQQVALSSLKGAVAMDPIGELVARGTIRTTLPQALDEMSEMTSWASKNDPLLGTIWVHGEHFNNGGANAVQELAFGLAAAVQYLREMEQRGISPETASQHVRFSFGIGSSFFTEIAKLRAARLVWYTILESCGLPEDSRKMWIHASTSRYTKTLFDPYVNMLRSTTEAFSGAVGGADSLHVSPFDEHIRPADEFSRRIARNTQLILKDEAHLGRVMDPAGGSWYIERLTSCIAESSWALLQKLEAKGGMTTALEEGFVQSQVAETASERKQAFDRRRDVAIGTNLYPNPAEDMPDEHQFDYRAIKESRSTRLKEFRASSKHEQVTASLDKLRSASGSAPGVMTETVIEAAGSGATVGELTEAIRHGKTGESSIQSIPSLRGSEHFERLRKAVLKRRSEIGDLVVYLATLGPVAKYMSRLDFSAAFFETGGFDVRRTTGHASVEETSKAAIEAKAAVVVICGLDDAYVEDAPAAAKLIKKSSPDTVVILAGHPADEELVKKLTESGVDIFIHLKSNVLETLEDICSRLGVRL